jgi:hypothetical protein
MRQGAICARVVRQHLLILFGLSFPNDGLPHVSTVVQIRMPTPATTHNKRTQQGFDWLVELGSTIVAELLTKPCLFATLHT